MASSNSYQTAVVLLPPPHISNILNSLRSANDKAWPRWSAHITLLFPFCPVEALPRHVEALKSALARLEPFSVKLDRVGQFSMRNYQTIHLGTSDSDSNSHLNALYKVVLSATAGHHNKPYVPHLTLGQTARNANSIAFLTDKANKLLERHVDFTWLVRSVAILRKREDGDGWMVVHERIPIGKEVHGSDDDIDVRDGARSAYKFDGTRWALTRPLPLSPRSTLVVATYNILHDPSFPFPSRLSHVLSALYESNADIVCLQEVTDESLALILRDERVRARWPWCSRAETSVMESERNVLLLAGEGLGFEWERVELGGKHKACIVARLSLPFPPPDGDDNVVTNVVIAGIHLTAGRADTILDKKREEMEMLLAYLHSHHEKDEWVVFGDVNWPLEEPFPDGGDLVDVWTGSDGATYDPTSNPIAAATARQSRTPERYDRVFLRKDGALAVRMDGLELFGLPKQRDDEIGSDHWGLKAAVRIHDEDSGEPTKDDVQAPATSLHVPTTTGFTDDDLHELCTEQGCFPSEAQNEAFDKAVKTLRAFLTLKPSNTEPPAAAASPIQFVVAPVGSFAMGYHLPGSDVDCVVVGNVSPETFWRLVRQMIRTRGSEGRVKLRRYVKDALVRMMELDVEGVKIDMQYCAAAKLIDCWDDLPNIPRDSPLFSLPASSLRTLNAHRDVLALLKCLPSLNTFRLAHRALKLFLSQKGIVNARFGFLGGFHLAFLLARVQLGLPPDTTAAQLVRGFFSVYAKWNWENEVVTVPIISSMEGEGGFYRRTAREPMVVLSVEKPQVNMTMNASANSLAVIKAVFSAADRECERGESWREVCGVGVNGDGDGRSPFKEFIREHKAFVKIEVNYWGTGCMNGRELVGWLESRFVGLLVQLHASAPTVRAHLWPARFADMDAVDEQTLNGFYLIGLSPLSSISIEERDDTKKEIQDKITAALRTFEAEICANARYDHAKEAFVSVTQVTTSQLPVKLGLDAHRWSDGGLDEEERETDSDGDEEGSGKGDSDLTFPSKKGRTSKSKPKQTLPAGRAGGTAKLRTSLDVYNRLLWDPAILKHDYVIGYEDRFKGTKETPLGSWKREVEDEAFIPFHRVVYFKRKSDGVVVWDRKARTDLVFGSG